jgi:hypothetical protein
MKEIGLMIKGMVKDLKDMQMVILILESFLKEKHMVMVYIHGLMEKFMMDSGIKDLNMDMVYGKVIKMIHMLVNGLSQEHMVMGSISGLMEINMKENGSHVLKMDLEKIHLRMETIILANSKMENNMEKENIFGKMNKFIMVNFLKV